MPIIQQRNRRRTNSHTYPLVPTNFKLSRAVPEDITVYTAQPDERQEKLKILGDGLAKQSDPQRCKFQFESLLVPLSSNALTVQASVF